MSHQLTLLATPADLAELEATFTKRFSLMCLSWRSLEATPKQLPGFSRYQPGRDDLKVLLVAPADIGEVRSEYVPAQRYWTVDTLRSPVVELSRCYVEATAIRPGRLYYREGYYGEGEKWILKSEDFRRWATDLLKTTKSVFRRSQGQYIGAEAAGMTVMPSL